MIRQDHCHPPRLSFFTLYECLFWEHVQFNGLNYISGRMFMRKITAFLNDSNIYTLKYLEHQCMWIGQRQLKALDGFLHINNWLENCTLFSLVCWSKWPTDQYWAAALLEFSADRLHLFSFLPHFFSFSFFFLLSSSSFSSTNNYWVVTVCPPLF